MIEKIMEKKKLEIIENATSDYTKLPGDKQMYVIGVMQGILLCKQGGKIADSEMKMLDKPLS